MHAKSKHSNFRNANNYIEMVHCYAVTSEEANCCMLVMQDASPAILASCDFQQDFSELTNIWKICYTK